MVEDELDVYTEEELRAGANQDPNYMSPDSSTGDAAPIHRDEQDCVIHKYA